MTVSILEAAIQTLNNGVGGRMRVCHANKKKVDGYIKIKPKMFDQN